MNLIGLIAVGSSIYPVSQEIRDCFKSIDGFEDLYNLNPGDLVWVYDTPYHSRFTLALVVGTGHQNPDKRENLHYSFNIHNEDGKYAGNCEIGYATRIGQFQRVVDEKKLVQLLLNNTEVINVPSYF